MKNILITLIALVSFNLLHSQTFPSPGFTLPAGKSIVITYEVEVNDDACPEGLVPVMNISNQATVSGSNFSNVLTDDPDIGGASDPTLTPFAGLAIGNLVFNDMNRNGMFDMSDVGIPGVVVNLYRDVNSNNMLDAMDGAPIGMTTTAMMPAGAYSFTVCPGTYIVEIAASNFTMGGALYNGGSPFVSSPIGGAPDPDLNTTDGDDNGDPVVGFGVASTAFTVSADRNDVDFAFKIPTTVTINDVTMSEGTGGSTTSFNFMVQRSDNVEAFSLTVNTMDGTATVTDMDYTAISGGIVMFTAGGNLEEMVTVLVNHDNKVEAAETFTVVLSSPPVGVTITDGTGLGTISNDDNATVTLTGTASQNEGTTFTFTATLDNPVQGGFMVDYSTADGTALVSDNDYTDNDGSLTFDGTAGEIETIMVSTIDDGKVELDETFTVALGMISLAPAGVSIGGMSQTGTIENNDQAIVTISNVSLDEGDMGMTAFDFTVTLDKEVDAAVGLNFTTMDGTATLADMDYVANSGMITPFTANGGPNQMRTITVQVNGDTEFEMDENFIVRLSMLSASGRDVIFDMSGNTLDGTGTILDDDIPPVIINEVDSDTEGLDMLEFVELYNGGVANMPLDGLVLVFYNGTTDQSYHVIDLDGFTTDASGYFLAGNAAVPGVDVTFEDNTLQNGADAVALYTGNATDFPNNTPVTQTNLIDAVVYDTSDPDDPGLLVLLNAGQPQVNENGGGNGTCHSLQRIPNGSGGQRNTNTYQALPPTPGAANIVSLVSISVSPLNTPEDGVANLTYTITRTGSTACDLPVSFTVGGTASLGSDYPAIADSPIIIPAGSASVDIVVDPTADNIVEPDETVIITLIDGALYDLGANVMATGTITNDDAATVTLTGTAMQNEGTTFTFTATLINPVQGGFMVPYNTNDGTATTGNNDYTDNDGTLTFTGTAGEFFNITINSTADNIVELDETFTVMLGAISGAPAGVTTSGSPQTGTVLNDDEAIVAIDANISQAEAVTLQTFTVKLSNPVDVDVSVLFYTSNGTATTADNDYNGITNQNVTFLAGTTTSQLVDVTINNDSKVENNEEYNVAIGTLDASGRNVSLGISSRTGTILNDDNATVTLSPVDGVSQNEGNSGTTDFVFMATVDNPVQGGFTVAYTTNDGTATTADNDYVDNDGTLSFDGTAGEMETITVQVNGDNSVEINENFTVLLGAINATTTVQTDAISIIGTNPQIGTILNDEVDWGDAPDTYATLLVSDGARHTTVFGFHLGATIDGEENGQPTVNADGDGADDDGVTIPGLVLNQMATLVVNASMAGKLNAWIDWEADGTFDMTNQIADNLDLNAGDNNLTIMVPSDAMEGTTFARFRLSMDGGLGPTGPAPNGEVEDYQVTISDVLFSINDTMALEGHIGTSNLVFRVTRNNNASNASVDYEITGGTSSVMNNDYEPLAVGTLNFTIGGAFSQFITVQVNGDNTVESDETIIMTLSNPMGAGIEDAMAIGTIMNDDSATLAISNPVLMEGNDGTTNAVFEITLSNPADFPITFNYGTQDGTATIADNDYQTPVQQNGSLLAGEQLYSVIVPVNGDCTIEPDEMFLLVLSDIVAGDNIEIPTTMGQATIQNDDALPVITCPGNVTQTVACNTTSKVITLPVPSTSSVCGTGTLEFRHRTVNSMNTPTGVYTAFAPSVSATLSFSLGRYEIEWRITDGSGMSYCSYYLQVNEMSISTPVIQGPTVICPSLSGLPYSVTPQAGVTSYQWSYSGSGVTIHNNGSAEVNLDFAEGSTAGTLMVTVINPCGGPNKVGNLNITLGDVLTCSFVKCLLSNLFVTDDTFTLPGMPQVFKIGGQITSDATIQSPKTILFKAGEGITLLPDFQVNPGAIFIAEIEDCPVIFPFVSGN